MKLTKESEYCLIALTYLSRQSPEKILQMAQVAEAIDVPKPFLSKIFVKLVRQKVLKSYRGTIRGYQLSKPPEDISIKEVLEIIEGPDVFKRCVFSTDRCPENNKCILHDHWQRSVRSNTLEMVKQLSLKQLSHLDQSMDEKLREGL